MTCICVRIRDQLTSDVSRQLLPRLQQAEECKSSVTLNLIKVFMNVISAMSLTCNDNRECACAEACNSEFRVDLFRPNGKLQQSTFFSRYQCTVLNLMLIPL